MAKKCTGCGTLDNIGLGLNKNGQPYLACCPESNYIDIPKSSIELIEENIEREMALLSRDYNNGVQWNMRVVFKMLKEINFEVQEAKKLHKKECENAWMDGFDHNSNYKDFEDYYNQNHVK